MPSFPIVGESQLPIAVYFHFKLPSDCLREWFPKYTVSLNGSTARLAVHVNPEIAVDVHAVAPFVVLIE